MEDKKSYFTEEFKESLKGSTPPNWWPENLYGYVPNYPKSIDTNPFNLIEDKENKS